MNYAANQSYKLQAIVNQTEEIIEIDHHSKGVPESRMVGAG